MNTNNTESDDQTAATRRIPIQTMADLVFNRPARKRLRLPCRLIFVAALLAMNACRATVPPGPEVETVGNLSASATHVYVAPVHASTDLTPGFQAVATDDDSPTETVTTVTRADGGDDANPSESPSGSPELPEVAPKTDGVVLGGAR